MKRRLRSYQRALMYSGALLIVSLASLFSYYAALPKAHADIQTTLYISPTGSDANDGSSGHPFASIAHARDVVRTINGNMSGDIVVYLHEGVYQQSSTLTFNQSDSGSNGYHILYEAYAGEKPTISGGQVVNGWSAADSSRNIWQANVGTSLQTRQLYVNGNRAIRAAGALPTALTRKGDGTGYTADNTVLAGWNNPSSIEFVYTAGAGTPNAPWTESRCGVNSIAGTDILMKQPCFANALQKQGNQNVDLPTSVENAYELLDQPGEWYLNTSTGILYYIPRSGEDLNSATVIAAKLETLVSGSGTVDAPLHNIEFHGITFSYATWLRPNGNEGFVEAQANFTVTSQSGLNPSPYNAFTKTPANISFTNAQGIRFERNAFQHLGGAGLDFDTGSQNNTIIGNTFTDISANGIQLGNVTTPNPGDGRQVIKNNQVTDNYLHDLPVEYHGGVGIWAGYVANTTIAHNELVNLPYSGISLGWGWGSANTTLNVVQSNHITNNLIEHPMQLIRDGGGIYTLGTQGTSVANGTLIDGNIVTGQGNDYNTLYNDGGSRYVTLTHNVLYNNANPTDWGGCNPVGDMVFENNYYQKPLNGWCGGPPPNISVQNNTQISDVSQAPASIVNQAGIESGYLDIKGGSKGVTNVAVGKTTTAASDYSNDFVAGKATDGNTATGWSPKDGNSASWLEVDLGQAYTLQRIELVTRQDLDQAETRRNFTIWASNNADMSQGHVVLCSQGGTSLAFQATFSCTVSDGTAYRYVAAVKTITEYFFISELRVFGA